MEEPAKQPQYEVAMKVPVEPDPHNEYWKKARYNSGMETPYQKEEDIQKTAKRKRLQALVIIFVVLAIIIAAAVTVAVKLQEEKKQEIVKDTTTKATTTPMVKVTTTKKPTTTEMPTTTTEMPTTTTEMPTTTEKATTTTKEVTTTAETTTAYVPTTTSQPFPVSFVGNVTLNRTWNSNLLDPNHVDTISLIDEFTSLMDSVFGNSDLSSKYVRTDEVMFRQGSVIVGYRTLFNDGREISMTVVTTTLAQRIQVMRQSNITKILSDIREETVQLEEVAISEIPTTTQRPTTLSTPAMTTALTTAPTTTAMPQGDGCKDVYIKAKAGQIMSPNYPNPYDDNLNCDWTIEVTHGESVYLIFDALDIEYHPSCGYDFLAIYDPEVSDDEPILRLCGDQLPKPVTTKSTKMILKFFSDVSVTRPGFKAYFQSTNATEVECAEDEIECPGEKTCLPLVKLCNGEFDCESGFDEKSCNITEPIEPKLTKNDLRLVDGLSCRSGRVEINYKGRWGTICRNEHIDENAAKVLCRMMGFGTTDVQVFPTYSMAGIETPFWLEMKCNGTESSITECEHMVWGITGCSNHGFDVSIACGTYGHGCTFELGSYNPCFLRNSDENDVNWYIGSRSSVPLTGPLAAMVGRYYLYVPAFLAEDDEGSRSIVESREFHNDGKDMCLSFYVHMSGHTMGTLNVYMIDIFGFKTPITSYAGNYGDKWMHFERTLNGNRPFKLYFEGIKKVGKHGDMAIDHVQVLPGQCGRTEDACQIPTPDPPMKPWCDFEDEDSFSCMYHTKVLSGKVNWTVSDEDFLYKDHTTSSGKSMHYSNPMGKSSDSASLQMKEYHTSKTSSEKLEFYYVYTESGDGRLKVKVSPSSDENVYSPTDDADWFYTCIDLPMNEKVEPTFTVQRGNENSILAIDDIKISAGKCDHGIETLCDISQPLKCHYTLTSQSIGKEQFKWERTAAGYSEKNGPKTDAKLGLAPLKPLQKYECSFEKDCFLENVEDELGKWTTRSSETSTQNTGPTSAHEGNYYAYIETTLTIKNDKAVFLSKHSMEAGEYCLTFFYHMYGEDINSLAVYLHSMETNASSQIWIKRGNRGEKWHKAEFDLVTSGYFKISFEALAGEGPYGDIALDDIVLTAAKCVDTKNRKEPDNIGHYLYASSSVGNIGDRALINFPAIVNAKSGDRYLLFYYFVNGNGALKLMDDTNQLWSSSGNTGSMWHFVCKEFTSALPIGQSFTLRFMAEHGGSSVGGVGVDEIRFGYGNCPGDKLTCSFSDDTCQYQTVKIGQEPHFLWKRKHYNGEYMLGSSAKVKTEDEGKQMTSWVFSSFFSTKKNMGVTFKVKKDGHSVFKVGTLNKSLLAQGDTLDKYLIQNSDKVDYQQITTAEYEEWTDFCLNMNTDNVDVALVFAHDLLSAGEQYVVIKDINYGQDNCPDIPEEISCEFSQIHSCRYTLSSQCARADGDYRWRFAVDGKHNPILDPDDSYLIADASLGQSGDNTTIMFDKVKFTKGGSVRYLAAFYGEGTILTISTYGDDERVLKTEDLRPRDNYLERCIPITGNGNIGIKFTAVLGNDQSADIVLDDVYITSIPCAEANMTSVNCTFEDNLCGWEIDEALFYRADPSAPEDVGHYLHSQPRQDKYMQAISIVSPKVDYPPAIKSCIEFAYLIYRAPSVTYPLSSMGKIHLYLKGEGKSFEKVSTIETVGGAWAIARYTTSLTQYYIKIEFIHEDHWFNYGIDNIRVNPYECSPITHCPKGSYACASKTLCIAEASLCNGIKDCPNGDDEKLTTCGASLSCNFDKNSFCGYTTYGHAKLVPDHLVMSTNFIAPVAQIESPSMTITSQSCLTYRVKSSKHKEPFRIMRHDGSSQYSVLSACNLKSTEDIWTTHKLTLMPGTYSVIFSLNNPMTPNENRLEVDDIVYYSNTRCDLVGCLNGFRCPMSDTCIPQDLVCNGNKECIDGEDEMNCGVKTFNCDFENENICSYETASGQWIRRNQVDTKVVGGIKVVTDNTVGMQDHLTGHGYFMTAGDFSSYMKEVTMFSPAVNITTKMLCFRASIAVLSPLPHSVSVMDFYYKHSKDQKFEKVVSERWAGVMNTTWKDFKATIFVGDFGETKFALRSYTYRSVIAIDNMMLRSGSCSKTGSGPATTFAPVTTEDSMGEHKKSINPGQCIKTNADYCESLTFVETSLPNTFCHEDADVVKMSMDYMKRYYEMSKLTPGCMDYLMKITCAFHYPKCSNNATTYICRSTCEEMVNNHLPYCFGDTSGKFFLQICNKLSTDESSCLKVNGPDKSNVGTAAPATTAAIEPPAPKMEVKLVVDKKEPMPISHGKVMIRFGDGDWEPVCSGFSMITADVLCKELGFRSGYKDGTYVSTALYKNAIECSDDDERKLSSCDISPLETCYSSQKITCNNDLDCDFYQKSCGYTYSQWEHLFIPEPVSLDYIYIRAGALNEWESSVLMVPSFKTTNIKSFHFQYFLKNPAVGTLELYEKNKNEVIWVSAKDKVGNLAMVDACVDTLSDIDVSLQFRFIAGDYHTDAYDQMVGIDSINVSIDGCPKRFPDNVCDFDRAYGCHYMKSMAKCTNTNYDVGDFDRYGWRMEKDGKTSGFKMYADATHGTEDDYDIFDVRADLTPSSVLRFTFKGKEDVSFDTSELQVHVGGIMMLSRTSFYNSGHENICLPLQRTNNEFNVSIAFKAVRGTHSNMDVGVDSIDISEKPCTDRSNLCNFEYKDMCNYTLHGDGKYQWKQTRSSKMSSDHTFENEYGNFMAAIPCDEFDTYKGETAVLKSPEFLLSEVNHKSVIFHYKVIGQDAGELRFSVWYKGTNSISELFTIEGNQGNEWFSVCRNLPAFTTTVALEFTATHGDGCDGHILLDDIAVNDGKCKTPLLMEGCSFDDPELCQFNVVPFKKGKNDFTWRRVVGNVPLEPLNPTKPKHDGTGDPKDPFMFASGNDGNNGDQTSLTFETFSTMAMTLPALYYDLNFHGSPTDQLTLTAKIQANDQSLHLTPFNDENWEKRCIPLSPSPTTDVTLTAKRGNNANASFALDNIKIMDGGCDQIMAECTFDDETMCGYMTTSEKSWSRKQFDDKDKYGAGAFIFSENGYEMTKIVSPRVDIDGETCIRFDFFLETSEYDKPLVTDKYLSVQVLHSNGSVEDDVWFVAEPPTSGWNVGQFSLNYGSKKEVRLALVKSPVIFSVQAGIDNVTVSKGPCSALSCNPKEFVCNNFCIRDEYVCDRVENCFSGEDEKDCGRSLSCDFETPYTCGYVNSTREKFLRVKELWTGDLYVKERTPVNGSEYFLATPETAVYIWDYIDYVLSPKVNISEVSCLTFFYLGSFSKLTITNELIDKDSKDEENIFKREGISDHNAWHSSMATLPVGETQLKYEITFEPSPYKHVFAIDEITLQPGNCSLVFKTCETGFFTCSKDLSCIPNSAVCNFQEDCSDGNDEENCPITLSCDFEHHNSCGYKVANKTASEQPKWHRLKAYAYNLVNVDHTLGTDAGHYMIYEDYRGENELVTPTIYKDKPGCVSFYYNVESDVNAAFFVYAHENGTKRLVHFANGYHTKRHQWVMASFDVTAGNISLTFRGRADVLFALPAQIAIDDVLHEEEACKSPSNVRPCNFGDFKCNVSRVCIPQYLVNNGVDDCMDGSDEAEYKEPTLPDKTHWVQSCTFESENEATCPFKGNDAWLRQKGPTPTNATGPSSAHSGDYYLYLEASRHTYGDPKLLLSQEIYAEKDSCMFFFYHMFGEDAPQRFSVTVITVLDGRKEAMEISGNKGNQWQFAYVGLPAKEAVNIEFAVLSGFMDKPDFALDDIVITPGKCFGPKDLQLRLVPGMSDGRVEIKDLGKQHYGPVCADNWSENNTKVACRMMGFSDKVKYHTYRLTEYGHGVDNTSMMHYKCTGTETSLTECEFSVAVCDRLHRKIGIKCTDDVCFHGERACVRTGEQPNDNSTCVPTNLWCDGNVDCPEGVDEIYCGNCTSSQFECYNHQCVDKNLQCSSKDDCHDRSDEFSCLNLKDDKTVAVNNRGKWYGICAEGITEELADYLCSATTGSILQANRTSTIRGRNAYALVRSSTTQGVIKNYEYSERAECFLLELECAAYECGNPSVDPTQSVSPMVLYGSDVVLGEYPWQVLLLINGRPSCGGSIIGREWILTAAHCTVYYSYGYNITFHVGMVDISKMETQGQHVLVENIYNNPLYSTYSGYNYHFDLALAKLAKPLTFDEHIRPVCIAPPSIDLSNYDDCYVTGWGGMAVNIYYNIYPMMLQEGKVSMLHPTECKKFWSNYGYFSYGPSGICVDNENPNSPICFGDSGGPLVCRNRIGRWEQMGVTSYGAASCFGIRNSPDVYQNVSMAFDWIEQVTGLAFSTHEHV